MLSALSPAVLAELRRPRRYPAVSVVMPTHRREPENAQDPVRLRNLLAEAKKRVEADPAVSRADRLDVVAQLDQALAEVDLVHAEDGLVILAAPGEHQVWSLARSVPERVVIAETFLTRNLVSAQASEQPFWVLALDADHATLWGGTEQRLVEERDGGFPRVREPLENDVQRKERKGDTPSTFTDEETRGFLREVDGALAAVLAVTPRPLYLVGEAAALSLLDDVGTAVKSATARVTQGGLAQGPAEPLLRAVWPAVAAQAEREVAEVLKELEKARGKKAFVGGVDEVWQKVSTGRVALVAVEENYQVTVRDDGEHLVPAEAGRPGAREDMVDETVEHALDTGARVRFVPDGTLAEVGHLAAVLRY